MNKPIFELVNELPTNNVTVMMLRSLDFVVPGEWQNIVGFENMIREVTGESDEEMIQAIGDIALSGCITTSPKDIKGRCGFIKLLIVLIVLWGQQL